MCVCVCVCLDGGGLYIFKAMFRKRAAVFYWDLKTCAARFLKGFKNIPQKLCPSGVQRKVQVVRGRY